MSKNLRSPKGTRDFLPLEASRRNYLFNTIREVYQQHGYMPVETPAFELRETLTGKYGEEGDKLIFRVMNQGNKVAKADVAALEEGKLARFANSLAERALRFDLTVPFARLVVQHRNDITFPFKRYQIQPVWRGDAPQAGRYQEFYQCDADVIGSTSLWNEVELSQIIDQVFGKLNMPVVLKISNRKILQGIAEVCGIEDQFMTFTIILDKLDKIGPEKVFEEMRKREIPQEAIDKIAPLLELGTDPKTNLEFLTKMLESSEVGMKGIEELSFIFKHIETMNFQTAEVEFDVTLARGLNYYTGAIFEVKGKSKALSSSILGGGRYDDLTSIFGLKDVSGVGISFGADRIYDILLAEGLFPDQLQDGTQLMFVNFGDDEAAWCMKQLPKIRAAGINAELYPHSAKMSKQLKYADKKGIRYAALVGSQEIEQGRITLKDLNERSQHELTVEELIEKIR